MSLPHLPGGCCHGQSAPEAQDGIRLAGFFDRANAILAGRTSAPGSTSLSRDEAVLDALTSLNVPVIADIRCGRLPPYTPIPSRGCGHIVRSPSRSQLTQTLNWHSTPGIRQKKGAAVQALRLARISSSRAATSGGRRASRPWTVSTGRWW